MDQFHPSLNYYTRDEFLFSFSFFFLRKKIEKYFISRCYDSFLSGKRRGERKKEEEEKEEKENEIVSAARCGIKFTRSPGCL